MKIALYCSAKEHLPQQWIDCARALGRFIATEHHTLVYGGVDAGLMAVAAQATAELHGRIVGVVPRRRADRICRFNSETIHTADLSERKRIMMLLSDIFVVLPGGYGTLDELATTFSHISFTSATSKHIILVNIDGIFSPLLEQLRLMAKHGLADAKMLKFMSVVESEDQLIEELNRLTTK
ncbi:MAG: TIGR00730 family Rossman fold protein [Muribaculaceae bacterium]